MKSCAFMLEGTVPSKKNQRRTFYKYGRVINIPSKQYEDWHKDALAQLEVLGVKKMNPPYKVHLSFWMKDKHRKDMDNSAQSVLELLQDAEVIEDDDCKLLQEVHLYYKGTSKDAPRVKVQIDSEIDKPGDYVILTNAG